MLRSRPMPFTFDVSLAFGWHVTIFVSWGSLAVVALAILTAVGTKVLVSNPR
jgi:hypothetical protein